MVFSTSDERDSTKHHAVGCKMFGRVEKGSIEWSKVRYLAFMPSLEYSASMVFVYEV